MKFAPAVSVPDLSVVVPVVERKASEVVSVPVRVSMICWPGKFCPAETSVEEERQAKVRAALWVRVIAAINFTEVPSDVAAVPMVRLGVFVAPVQSIELTRGMSSVTTWLAAVKELASKTAVSCGRGTRPATAPPEVVNHLEADQLPVPETQY